jgi:glycosyltransferase involved in cell wall biosynthesis
MSIAVLMSTYHGESAAHLRESLDSLAAQTLRPDEVIVVKDGPLTRELEDVLAHYTLKLPLVVIPLEQNAGLGTALAEGLRHCSSDFVARMDTDDVCPPIRLEMQVKFMKQHPDCSVLSASAAEFSGDLGQPYAIRSGPDVVKRGPYARFRNPIGHHSAVLFRRADVLASGGYQTCPFFEDYDLWARMMMLGYRLYNMPEVLVFVRAGSEMLRRRRGITYIRSEVNFLRKMHKIGFLSTPYFLANLLVRLPCRLLPEVLLRRLYRIFLREPVFQPSKPT